MFNSEAKTTTKICDNCGGARALYSQHLKQRVRCWKCAGTGRLLVQEVDQEKEKK